MRVTILSTFILFSMTTINNTQIAEGTNKAFQFTIATTATPEKIWQIWTDVPNWKVWDTGLQSAELKGDFKVGTKGVLIPDKGPKAKFKITEFKEGKSYAFRTGLPFGSLVIERVLEEKEGKTLFTHKVSFKGLGGSLFAGSLGKRYRKMLPEVMERIKQLVEE